MLEMSDGVPARILIVDDDPALLEALPETMRLRIPGTIVDTAMSAAEALTSIAGIDHDVIVTDLVMPGMTGIDLIRKIREVRPRTPMILMSGNPNPQGYALRTRAYGFIQKPIDRDYLIATLRRAIRYSRLSKRAHGKTEDVQKHLDKLSEIQRRMVEHAEKVQSHYAGRKAMASMSESATSKSSSQS
jgi:two-component system, sensor histidine kinase and response regulator